MASSLVVKLVSFAIVCFAIGATNMPKAQAVLSCNDVVNNLTPCVSYIVYGGSTVPVRCCNGVRNLYGMARTTPDRQAVCTCIKNTVNSSGFAISNNNINLAASIPRKCGVNIPYQISPNTDCSRVQ